jgi:protein-S-isoprenylcysteine O-methyltransferase Ste14
MSAGIALALAFTAGWLPLFFLRTENVAEAFRLYRPAEQATSVITPVVLTLHMGLGCLFTSLTSPLPPLRTATGTLLFFAGVGFWLWGRASIGPWRTRRGPDRPPLRFRRDGPFGWVRHPLYFGLLLSSAALVIVTARSFLLLTLAACVITLDVRARQEEARLRAQVGTDYEAYCREVKRLVPFVW